MPLLIHENFGNDKHAELNVYICAEDKNLKPGVRYGPVIRDLYIIECCTAGYGSVIINGNEFKIGPKTCIILKPGDIIVHTADNINPRSGVWCGINGLSADYYVNRLGIDSKNPYAPEGAFDAVCENIEKLIELKECKDPGAELRRCAIAQMIFGQLLMHTKAEAEPARYIKDALHIIHTQFANDIDINYIASQIGLERCYFSTLFKRQTGLSPHQYLTRLRIQKACSFLLNPTSSIQDVSIAVGIRPDNFSRVFEKHTGLTPSQYRKKSAPLP